MATKDEIVEAIEGLAIHCRTPIFDENERVRWLMDWCSDLGPFPAKAINQAAGEWRRSGQAKFPTPGQLIPLVAKYAPPSKSSYKPTPVRFWEWPSDDEYFSMSISEKIKAHTIMAHDLRSKAGPMFRQRENEPSVHLSLDEMPPKWHTLQREAKFHDGKVSELRKRLKERA